MTMTKDLSIKYCGISELDGYHWINKFLMILYGWMKMTIGVLFPQIIQYLLNYD